MQKEDLRSGMMVQFRDETFGIIFLDTPFWGDIIGGLGKTFDLVTWGSLDNINEDLTHKTFKQYNIDKVYKPLCPRYYGSHDFENYKLIWER